MVEKTGLSNTVETTLQRKKGKKFKTIIQAVSTLSVFSTFTKNINKHLKKRKQEQLS